MTDDNKENQYADMSKEEVQIVLVCGHCANHDNRRAILEINFIDMIMYYTCSKCKKINKLDFAQLRPKPYPRIGISRNW
jgi:hypothetical protein